MRQEPVNRGRNPNDLSEASRAALIKHALIALMVLAVATSTLAQPPKVEPSPELQRLHFQLGSWLTTTRTLDRNGEEVSTRRGRAEIRLEHGGLMIHILVYPQEGDEPVWRIWHFHDRYDGKLHDVSFDAVGHFEHREETNGDGKLAFAFPEPRAFQDGVPRNWRKTYSGITADSFQLLWDYTEDGETWIPIYETTYRREASVESNPGGSSEAAHTGERGLGSLEPWVGVWVSRLDPKYRDHPMIQRFNPELKSQELRLSRGITGDTLDLEIWHLDRPTDGARIPATEGMAVRDPADGSMALIEYGAEQRIFHQGHYEVQPNGDLHRTYEAFFPDGSSRRFRELWRWKDAQRKEFEWITQWLEGDDWISGDVIVDWVRQEP